MTNEVLIKEVGASNIQIMFRDATDFPNSGSGPPTTAANDLRIGTPTEVQIDLTSVAASGGARQSAKVDLGADRASAYSFTMCAELAPTPADGGALYLFWAPSPSSTAATGNPGGTTGSDAAFTDTAGNLGQLQSIGPLSIRANIINIGYVGTISPKHRYGNLVIVNQSDQAFHTVMDETHIVMTPEVIEIQDAP